MQEKTNKEKLRINKETIRNLSDESLDQVAGGGNTGLLTICNVNVSAKKSCLVACSGAFC